MAKYKVKDPNRLPFSGYAGTTLSAATYSIVAALMTSYFMLYLTDYSGLGAFGATLGSGLLVFARAFDAVNDPLEGWIVNKAKPGRNGKYRKFLILSTVLMGVGVTALFFIPSAIVNSSVFVGIYVIVFYLLYDIGYAFFMQEPLFRTMTLNADERGKLLIGPRLMNMVMGIVISALAMGASYIPVGVINMETMYYDVYKNDKDRAAIQFSASKLIEKAQQAFATAMVGVILTAVGYVVDSATDTYIGDLAKMPILLNWFTVIMGLLPLLFGITSYLIMRHYPITPEIREQIRRKTQQ